MSKIHDPNSGVDLIGSLLEDMGIKTPYIAFDSVSEGKTLPGNFVNESGAILASNGKVYRFWLDWNDEKIAPDGSKGYYTLGENFKDPDTKEPYPLFREATSEDYKRYQKDFSYILARKKLNLPVTVEQQKILDNDPYYRRLKEKGEVD